MPQIIMPLALSFLSALALWLGLSFLMKDSLKAGLITSTLATVFYSYGYIFDGLTALNLFSVKNRHLIPIILYIAGYVCYFIILSKKKSTILNISKIFTFAITVLIILNIATIIPNEITKYDMTKKNTEAVRMSGETTVKGVTPDIYYIILDEYASLSTIKDIWNYDNSEFANYMKSQGFFIAEKSKAKYISTQISLPSYLNMEYVSENLGATQCYQLINNNKVMSYLKNKGYKTIAFDTWYSWIPAKGAMNADLNFNYDQDSNSYLSSYGFISLLKSTTMIKPIKYLEDNSIDKIIANANRYTLNKLKEIPSVSGPKFVYAHVLCPHTPFSFGRNGQEVSYLAAHNWKDKRYYLDQYIFISNQIKELVENIIKKSKQPPIIIIQSDHGPRPQFDNVATKNEIFNIPEDEMFKIFNAYFLPYGGERLLTTDTSPINTFRIIFNYYFKDNFELLEE